MIHNLVEKLATMNGGNVDIAIQNESNGVLMYISTEKFSSGIDEFYLTLDNNVLDCNFDIKLPISKIVNVDFGDFQDGMIVINLVDGLEYIITMI